MSINMLNKIRTELEIFAFKVDHPAATLKTRTRKLAGNKGHGVVFS
jgi:hypothetical protein